MRIHKEEKYGLFGLLRSWSFTYSSWLYHWAEEQPWQKKTLPSFPVAAKAGWTSINFFIPASKWFCTFDFSTYPLDSTPSLLCFHKKCIFLVHSRPFFLAINKTSGPWLCFWYLCVVDCVMLFNSFNKVESFGMPCSSGSKGFCCYARLLMHIRTNAVIFFVALVKGWMGAELFLFQYWSMITHSCDLTTFHREDELYTLEPLHF